jgi:exopolysaccharide biosynthesis protein
VAIQSWENVEGKETARETITSKATARWWLQNSQALKRRERLREDRWEGQTSQVINEIKTSEVSS